MNQTAQLAIRMFSEKFGGQPSLYFSPGRVNLIGEHIDYNDGFVLPAAIDKGIYFAVAPNGTGTARFYAADFGEDAEVDLDRIEKSNGWRNYLYGVLHELMVLQKPVGGFDCVFAGDIPIGSGMSSSAAAEGGLAFAVNDLFDCGLQRMEMALLCQRAEHNYPGVQCGIMDQFANMMGRTGQAMLLDCRSLQYEYLPLTTTAYSIVLVNSMVRHSLASGEYNTRRQQCEEGLRILKEATGVSSFREVTHLLLEPVKTKMEEKIYDRCRYVIEEIDRTKKAAEAMGQNNAEELGRLMLASHAGLRDLYEVSCPELDHLVSTAIGVPGVIGARMMGGGFGGCTINLVKNSSRDIFMETIQSSYHTAFGKETEIYEVATADGTKRMDINTWQVIL